ncbi:hypothetical protein AB1N83_010711 [Pleurotus pulmonarius]
MPADIRSTPVLSAPRSGGDHPPGEGADDTCCRVDFDCRGAANSRFLQSWKCLGFVAAVVSFVVIAFVFLKVKQ